MSYKVIQGTFHVVGYSPDPDSIRFQANNPKLWDTLAGSKVKINDRGHVQLREEAIDGTESHFLGLHQPVEITNRATDFQLDHLGIKNVRWSNPKALISEDRGRVISADDGVPGYILTRYVERYHRPVSFVFAGDSPFLDGADVFLTPEILDNSVNDALLESGMVFATFYDGLFDDLREYLATKALSAKAQNLGVHALDKSLTGFNYTKFADLQNDTVILPKLFRRLVSYHKARGPKTDLKSFLASLQQKVKINSTGQIVGIEDIVEVNGNTCRLLYDPVDLTFIG